MQQPELFKKEETDQERQFKAYSYLFDFFFQEHDLMLLQEQMDEICHSVNTFKKMYDGEKTTTNSNY